MIIDLKELKNKYNLNFKGVIHIGAHYGEENDVYEELDIKNRMFFEPCKDNFNILKQKVGDDFVLVNVALGSENKKIDMYIESANNGQSNSLLKPDLHLQQYPHIQFNKTETVDMIRLDDYKFDRTSYNFINIDVQGFELEVFKGAKETLKNIDYIYSEINRDEVYENCAKIDEMKNFLGGFNFKLVEECWSGGTWGDGLFIKV